MRTRAEAIATARGNIQPGIDAARTNAETLEALVAERVRAVDSIPGVVTARDLAARWQATFQERVTTALNAPGITTPQANAQVQRALQRTREGNLAARIAAINAYYDELARRAQTEPIVTTPPDEAA